MREIRFRAWDKRKRKMYYDVQDLYDPTGPDHPGSCVDCFGSLLQDDSVDVLQYTGLKDRNAKEIYEGDILRFAGMMDVYSTVYFADGIFYASDDQQDTILGRFGSDVTSCEVIGNVYENTELLK